MIGAQRWKSVEPTEAGRWFRDVALPWWIAGGWAMDLFAERVSREHEDLDVGVFSRDVWGVLGALPGWQVFEAKNGGLTELRAGVSPRDGVHSLWCRRDASSPWELEVMLETSSGVDWVYRRDSRVRRPLRTLFRRSTCGLNYLSPEIQLLYKSKHVRACDDADLRNALPLLSREERKWLKNALTVTDLNHAWHEPIDRVLACNELEKTRDE